VHVDLNGQTIYYETSGDKGTPILFIMGFGVSGQAWTPQINCLKEHHQVVWFDNRGVGRSAISAAPYGLVDLAGDARKLIEHLGWKKVHVVGVSMGGIIAQQFAFSYPSYVQSLSLIATLPFLSLKPSKLERQYAPSKRGLYYFIRANTLKGEKRLECLRHLLFSDSYLKRSTGEENFSEESMESFAVPADRWTLWNQLKGILRFDNRDRLHILEKFPTVILRPEGDLLVSPRNSDLLHSLIPGSKLVSFPLAGHGLIQECADSVNEALLDHFVDADNRASAGASA
jgi:pimeloyl-ACP methyl ester carboxylesterase